MPEWQELVKNQLHLHGEELAVSRLVCIDLQMYATSQAPDSASPLGGLERFGRSLQ